MKDLSITGTLGSKIKATLHDILCNISGYDIVLISDIGPWGDTLSDHQVFDDIKSWIQTTASQKNQTEIFNAVQKITYQPDHPNIQIARLLIIVFELLSPKIHIPQVALKVWIDGGEKKLVLNLLDPHQIVAVVAALVEPERALDGGHLIGLEPIRQLAVLQALGGGDRRFRGDCRRRGCVLCRRDRQDPCRRGGGQERRHRPSGARRDRLHPRAPAAPSDPPPVVVARRVRR